MDAQSLDILAQYIQYGVLGSSVVVLATVVVIIFRKYTQALKQLNEIQELRVSEAKEVIEHLTTIIENYKDALNANTVAVNNLKEIISIILPNLYSNGHKK